MTAELKRLSNDPNFVVEFAMGPPSPHLPRQSRSSGIRLFGVYDDSAPKRYIMKSAHLSADDIRVFDHETGRVVYVSHHPGKNPYDALDPLGLTNTDAMYNVAGGEWQSMCDVSAMEEPFGSFKIRPKWMSRHGRQSISVNDEVVMNIGKIGKLKSKSLRSQFMVGEGDSKDATYKCVADMVGRSIVINNEQDETVAVIAKTNKAMMLTAAFGKGSESTIDVAPGVDCSTILAILFGLKQVGKHFVNDAFGNYVTDPLTNTVTDAVTDSVTDAVTGEGSEEFGEDQEHAEYEGDPEEEVEQAYEEPEQPEQEDVSDAEADGEGISQLAGVAQGMFSSFFGGNGGGDEGEEEDEGYGEEEYEDYGDEE